MRLVERPQPDIDSSYPCSKWSQSLLGLNPEYIILDLYPGSYQSPYYYYISYIFPGLRHSTLQAVFISSSLHLFISSSLHLFIYLSLDSLLPDSQENLSQLYSSSPYLDYRLSAFAVSHKYCDYNYSEHR
jgi:hypothetical protein